MKKGGHGKGERGKLDGRERKGTKKEMAGEGGTTSPPN